MIKIHFIFLNNLNKFLFLKIGFFSITITNIALLLLHALEIVWLQVIGYNKAIPSSTNY
jgi:hypothetical protein